MLNPKPPPVNTSGLKTERFERLSPSEHFDLRSLGNVSVPGLPDLFEIFAIVQPVETGAEEIPEVLVGNDPA